MVVSADPGLLTDSWQLLHDAVSGNIVDPSNRSKKWIWGEHPDVQGRSFPGYPIITLSSARVDPVKQSFKTLKSYPMGFRVGVFDEQNARKDVLVGSIVNLFSSKESQFLASGLAFIDVLPLSHNTFMVNDKKVHNTDFVFQVELSSV